MLSFTILRSVFKTFIWASFKNTFVFISIEYHKAPVSVWLEISCHKSCSYTAGDLFCPPNLHCPFSTGSSWENSDFAQQGWRKRNNKIFESINKMHYLEGNRYEFTVFRMVLTLLTTTLWSQSLFFWWTPLK